MLFSSHLQAVLLKKYVLDEFWGSSLITFLDLQNCYKTIWSKSRDKLIWRPILKFHELEYESGSWNHHSEPYSSLWNSSTIYVRLHSTQIHQTQVQDTHNSSLRSSSTSWHFLMPKIQFSQCYGEMFTRNSSLLNSSIIWNSSLRNSSTKKVVVC